MKFRLLLYIGFIIALSSCTSTQKKPQAEKGVLDLSEWDFDANETVLLSGEWEFYWEQLLSHQTIDSLPPGKCVNLPGFWNAEQVDDKKLGGFGYATYSLQIKLPEHLKNEVLAISSQAQSTAYNISVNGQRIVEAGKVGKDASSSVPYPVPTYNTFVANSDTLEVLVQVSNFDHRKGGIRNQIEFGTNKGIVDLLGAKHRNEWLFIGVVFIIIVYHFFLYFNRKKSKMPLYFSLLCTLFLLRAGITGERIFVQEFSFISYKAMFDIGHLTYFLSVPLALHYLSHLFKGHIPSRLVKISYFLAVPFVLFTLVMPPSISSYSIPWFNGLYFSGVLYIAVKLVVLSIKRVQYSGLVLLGTGVVIATAANDILYVNQVIQTGYMVHFGLIALIFSQVLVLSMKFSSAYVRNEKLLAASVKFVPSELLKKLKKDSLTELNLGDQIQTEMTILFVDIRSFTSMSEKMNPRENFEFINSYLERMGPVVRKNGGFIDKYIGDAIMALFDRPDQAMNASIEISHELDAYNAMRETDGHDPVRIGMGIHTGKLMMGIIGEHERLEGTVISDAVNLASRLEGVTKNYQSTAVFSDATLEKLENPEQYKHRMLDLVKVKGKEEKIVIHELLDGLSETDCEKRVNSSYKFKEALELLWSGQVDASAEIFTEIYQENQEDFAAEHFLEKCKQYKQFGANPSEFFADAI